MTKRENPIIDLLYQNGELSIQELSELLGASHPSIRRDLAALNKDRCSGGFTRCYAGNRDNGRNV